MTTTIWELSWKFPLRWFDDAAEGTKLGKSLGILAFSYKGESHHLHHIRPSAFTREIIGKTRWGDGNLAGPMFIGVKLIGDTYVPAGEESTRVNTTDGTVRSFNLGVLLHSATITITIKQNFYTTDGMVRTSLWGFALFATITIKQKGAKQKELLHNRWHG